MASYKELILKIGADTTGLNSGLESAKTSIGGLKDHAAGLATIGAGLTASLTAPILGIGTAAVQAAGQMQQTVKSFETLLGSGQAAAAMLKDLENFAKSTPFEFNQLVDASKRMLAFGFTATDVIPTLTAIGDSVAALGGNGAMVDRVTTALGQMKAKGKASAEEMLQLAEAGIPAWDMLAKGVGLSVAETMKAVQQGKVGAEAAIGSLVSGMTEKFGGLMAEQSTTLLGQISNIQDTFSQSLTRLGQVLLPFAQQAVSLAAGMADAFSGAVDAFAGFPEPIQAAIAVFGGLLAAVGPVLATVGGLVMAWASVGPTVTAAGTAIAAVATGPIGIAVAAGAALAAGVTFLLDQFGVLDPILAAIGDVFDNVSGAVSAVWENLDLLAAGFSAWISETINGSAVLSTLFEVLQTVGGFIGGAFSTAFSFVADIIKSTVIYHIDLMTQGLGWLKDKAVELFNFFLGKGKEALGSTAEDSKAAADGAKALATEVATVGKAAGSSEPQVKKFSIAVAQKKKEVKEAKIEVFNLDKSLRELEKTNRELEKRLKEASKALAEDLAKEAGVAELAVADLSAETIATTATIQTFANTAANHWDGLSTLAGMRASDIARAFEEMGIAMAGDMTATAEAYQRNFEIIRDSGQATPQQVNEVWIKALEARKAAAEANGQALAEEDQKTLDRLLAQQEGYKTNSVNVFSQLSMDVRATLQDLGQQASDALFSGKFSLDNVKSTLSSMADTFRSSLAQPAKDAIADLIDKGINALMGALDGVIGKLTGTGGVQSAMEAAFGGISGGAGNTAGAAAGGGGSIPTGGGGGGGGGASAAGGAMGMVNMITGIATAISSVIGNFQMAKMETSLNAIEHNTRYTMMYVGERADGGILGQMFRVVEALEFGAGTFAVQQIRDKLLGDTGITPMKLNLDGIKESTAASVVKQNDANGMLLTIRDEITRLVTLIQDFVGRDVVIEIDGQEIARAVGAGQEELRSTA